MIFTVGDIVYPNLSTYDECYKEVYDSISCEVLHIDRELLTVLASDGNTYKCFANRFNRYNKHKPKNLFNDDDFIL